MEELPYPRGAETWHGMALTHEDHRIMLRQDDTQLEYTRMSTRRDAFIMRVRTAIGPSFTPAKKNLAVFLKYN